MDRPSSSRVRPTVSNRRHSQRIEEVVEEVEEPKYDLEKGNEEEGAPVEHLDEEEVVLKQEITAKPKDRSLLPSFNTHIAAYIWHSRVCIFLFYFFYNKIDVVVTFFNNVPLSEYRNGLR